MEPDRGRPGSLPASSPAAVHRQDARLIDRKARSTVMCSSTIAGLAAPALDQPRRGDERVLAWAYFGHTRPRSGHSDPAELPWLTRQMLASRVRCGCVTPS